MKTIFSFAKFITIIALLMTWAYVFVVKYPVWMTMGGVYPLIGVAFLVLSVTVPAFWVWTYYKGRTKTTSNKE